MNGAAHQWHRNRSEMGEKKIDREVKHADTLSDSQSTPRGDEEHDGKVSTDMGTTRGEEVGDGVGAVMLVSSNGWAQRIEHVEVRPVAKGLGARSSNGGEQERTGGIGLKAAVHRGVLETTARAKKAVVWEERDSRIPRALKSLGRRVERESRVWRSTCPWRLRVQRRRWLLGGLKRREAAAVGPHVTLGFHAHAWLGY